jgi:hypothetical protein
MLDLGAKEPGTNSYRKNTTIISYCRTLDELEAGL